MIYYLDKINGNDTNSGTTIETAFATWSKVLAVNKSGDTVYVLPAYYNEVITTTQNGVKYIAVNDGVCSLTQNVITSSTKYSGDCYITAYDSDNNIVNSSARIVNNKNDVWFVGFKIITNLTCYNSISSTSNNIVYKCYLEARGLTQRCVINTGDYINNNGNKISKCILISPYRCLQNINIVEYSLIYSTFEAVLNAYSVNFCVVNGGHISASNIISTDSNYGSTSNIVSNDQISSTISYNNYIEQSFANGIVNNVLNFRLQIIKNYIYMCNGIYNNISTNTTNNSKLNVNDLYYTLYTTLNTGVQYYGSPKILLNYTKRCNELKINKHNLGFSIDDSKYTVSGSSLNYYMNYNFDLTSTIYNSNNVYYNPNNYTLFYSTSNIWKIVNSATTNDVVSNFYSGSTLNGIFYGNGIYSGDTCYMYDYVNLCDYYGYTKDFQDMPLRNYDNKMQVGATQTSDIDLIDENTIKINRKGYNTIKLKVIKYQTYKIDVNLTFSGSTNPYVYIYDYENNDIIKNIEYEISGLSSGVETNINTITFTPNKTGIIRIIFYNTDYNVNSYLQISDFKILKV